MAASKELLERMHKCTLIVTINLSQIGRAEVGALSCNARKLIVLHLASKSQDECYHA